MGQETNALASFDIALMGWGTRGAAQVTVEQLRALGEARTVVVDPGAPASIFRMLEAYPADVHDLRSLYRDDAEKRDVYPAMAKTVVALAESRGPAVWMTYGHPLVYSMPSRILIRECRERGLRLSILSGISSIAEIMSALEIDIAERGLQVHFANDLVSLEKRIDPSVDLLVMQPGGLGETRLCRDAALRRVRDVTIYERLQSHLERFYPSHHRFTSICLSDESGGAHEIFEAPISRVVELAPELHYGHTWYVRAIPGESPESERGPGAPVDGSGPPPPALSLITKEARASGTFYGSDARFGRLLGTLAASKPGGRLLELGTGIGLGTAWLLHGMDARARLTTVDVQEAGGIARRYLGDDPRIEFVIQDASPFLSGLGSRKFDLIFADAPPGKFLDLDLALDALAPGGFYVADDMIPDPGLPGRALLLDEVAAAVAGRKDLEVTAIPWATGVLVATKRT